MRFSIITPEHRGTFLKETWLSIKQQTCSDFEWVVVVNGDLTIEKAKDIIGEDDPRIRVVDYGMPFSGIGAIKNFAFNLGLGEILVELDGDDLLTKDALVELDEAFKDETLDFAYSNFADFLPDWSPSTFGERGSLNGWRYKDTEVDGRMFKEAIGWEPSAAALSYVWYAPNHVRAWKADFYKMIEGHDITIPIADDHELLIRTFLNGRMKKIDKLLYLYRVGDNNTWNKNGNDIAQRTHALYAKNHEALVLRECQLKGEPVIDLGGGFSSPAGWIPCDLDLNGQEGIQADLNQKWPFEDYSVGAFRAHDLIEHLPNKQHTMSEIHRCLKPGGYLLSQTPSTDGRGAFQDPTHVAFWNENSFWYWTRQEQAKYIKNDTIKFIAHRLCTDFPNEWCKQNQIPYVYADLIAYKGDCSGIPGLRGF